MSLLDELGFPSPLIAYSVLQQVSSASKVGEYQDELKAALQKTLAEASNVGTLYDTALADARMKSAQVARGSLNAYLSTPIKSDNEDVQRIIREALEKYSEQSTPAVSVGISSAWCSRLIAEPTLFASQGKIGAAARRMHARGKKSLRARGFTKTSANIFESGYVVKGGFNLDLLESILKRTSASIGIASPPGPHSNEFSNVLFNLSQSDQSTGLWEVILSPPAVSLPDTEVTKEAAAFLTLLAEEFNLHRLSLWRTRFPAGVLEPHVIRLRMIPDQKLLFEVLKWFSSARGPELKRNIVEGALLVAEHIA